MKTKTQFTNRILSLVLSIMMVISMLPASALSVFAAECDGWTDEQFHQAELLIMGLQYAAIVPTDANFPVKMRISGALNQILSIYNVDEETRREEIQKVLDKDCREISKRVLEAFTDFVKKKNARTLNEAQNAFSKKEA